MRDFFFSVLALIHGECQLFEEIRDRLFDRYQHCLDWIGGVRMKFVFDGWRALPLLSAACLKNISVVLFRIASAGFRAFCVACLWLSQTFRYLLCRCCLAILRYNGQTQESILHMKNIRVPPLEGRKNLLGFIEPDQRKSLDNDRR